MHQLGNDKATPRKARGVVKIAAALLGAAVFCQPALVSAAPHGGGGGFHGGGFGGFHAGGFHAGGFHGGWHGGFAGVHNGFGHEGHWYHGWHGGRYGWWWTGPGLAWTYYNYPWWGYYPDYGYYDYSQPSAGQTWYYCSDPAGYYPNVTQCNTA